MREALPKRVAEPASRSSARKPARRNRTYATPEKIRAAYLAGQGKNATEIATELGNTTERKIRDMLRDAGVRMERPFGRPKAVQIHCTLTDMRRLDEAAAEREAAPGDFALHLLRLLLSEPTLLRNLLDEAEAAV
ncbi:hypothetical protein AB6806_10915 [Bosea sp. RCC_152_1]|uniref:hypothetical protein n=1 Tax=Bosea sp. RCC_152_1 TaxID=3239228 RepID=UPI003524DC99